MGDCSRSKQDVLKRLNRIEGQVKGIKKMVEGDKLCVDILIQIAAIRAAINKVGGIILENHSKACIENALCDRENNEDKLDELIKLILKFMN